MNLFNFFKSSKKENQNAVVNSIGRFTFVEFDGTKNFKGIINSKINDNIELLFPINNNEISVYQIEYFKKIENSWDSILQKLTDKNQQINFENFEVVNILIPDQGNEFYEEHAEIVLKKNSNIISVILKDLNVEEIIES